MVCGIFGFTVSFLLCSHVDTQLFLVHTILDDYLRPLLSFLDPIYVTVFSLYEYIMLGFSKSPRLYPLSLES